MAMKRVDGMSAAGFLLIMLLFSSCAQVGPTTTVSVMGPNASEKVISTTEELSHFERLWLTKIEQTPPDNLKWLYKLDVTSESKGNRWLYDTRGWVRLLSVKRTPTYKISSAEEFNRLLGIK